MIGHVVRRLGATCAALVFMTMGGARGMDAHPLSSHASHHPDIIAAESESVAEHGPGAHAGHHVLAAADEDEEQPSDQDPTTACTCVGPCQGGTAPTATDAASYALAVAEMAPIAVVAAKTRLIDRDPTSHLLPLPNPPPART